jgi:broad specificity phosphatase PhoE
LASFATAAVALVSSDLMRAADTAEVIRSQLGIPIQHDSSMREQRLGSLEGRTTTELRGSGTVKSEIDSLWRDPKKRPDGGESVAEMSARILDSLHRLLWTIPDGEIIVVTHGGPIRALLLQAGFAPGIDPNDIRVGNGTVATFAVSGNTGTSRLKVIARRGGRGSQTSTTPDRAVSAPLAE